jgi:dTMP kinase
VSDYQVNGTQGKGDIAQHVGGRPSVIDAAESDEISPRAEALLFAADRAQHVAQIVCPVLSRGGVVITDRYLDSSLAYQAGGRELTGDDVRMLSMWATGSLLPRRTYLLDMDPGLSHQRLQHDADRMESAGDDFQVRTRQAFLGLAAAEPERFCVIDANRSIDDVWQAIRADIDQCIHGSPMHEEPHKEDHDGRLCP